MKYNKLNLYLTNFGNFQTEQIKSIWRYNLKFSYKMSFVRSRRTFLILLLCYILSFIVFYLYFALPPFHKNIIDKPSFISQYFNKLQVKTKKFTNTNQNEDTKAFRNEISSSIEQEKFIPDINNGSPRPEREKSNKQIFFIESTNPDGGNLILNPREACAIESAARYHPDRDIYVLFTGKTISLESMNKNKSMADILLKNFKNIYFRSVDVKSISRGSPLEEFVHLEKYKESKFYSSHFSDILRYLVLWKFGGLYCDLDIVVLKSFDDLGENYVGESSDNFIQSGTMDFSGIGTGHLVAEKCLLHLRDHFDGERWAANGPEVIAAVMKQWCNTTKVANMTPEKCQGIKVLKKHSFLPITNSAFYSHNSHKTAELGLVYIKGAYTAHVYNHLMKDIKITRDSQCLYLRLAKMYCPIIYDEFDTYF